MKKRFLALLLCVLLGAMAISTASAETEDLYPDELSILAGLSEHISKVGATSNNDNYVYKTIEEWTGTHVNWIHPAAGSDYDMQINLLVSSGDLPDMIVRSNWKDINGGLPMWEEDGVILDLTELMPEYMPNYMGLIEERDAMNALLVDGKLYYISEIGNASAYRGPLLRGDWLTALGLEVPTTTDELYDVLKAFQTQDPNGNDQADEWAVSGGAFSTDGNFGLGHLLWPWGITYDFMQIDGKVTYGPMEPEFTPAMEYIAKLYAEGMIDPDYSTQDRNMLDGKFMNNQVGYEYGMQPSKMNNAMEGTGFEAIGIPNLRTSEDSPAYVFGQEYIAYVNNFCDLVLTTACEEPEKALRWLDTFFSEEGILLTNFGIEGKSFVYDENGTPVYDPSGAIAENPELDETNYRYFYTLMSMSAFPTVQTKEAYYATLHPLSAEAISGWNESADVSRILPNIALTAEESEEINDKLVDIETYIAVEYDKLVTGQTPISEIPNIQQRLIELGIEDCIAVYQQAYDRYLGQ